MTGSLCTLDMKTVCKATAFPDQYAPAGGVLLVGLAACGEVLHAETLQPERRQRGSAVTEDLQRLLEAPGHTFRRLTLNRGYVECEVVDLRSATHGVQQGCRYQG